MKNTPRQTDIFYSDFRCNMDVHPVTGDLLVLKNEDAVSRSIINLLLTGQYESFFDSNRGAGLAQYLFENILEETADLIKDAIERCIKNYEPRAELISCVVETSPDMNAYSAIITFSVINQIEPVVIRYLLKRVR